MVIEINNWQKRRFADKIIAELFNTVADKKIAIFGFAFKKNTGDTRESSAIYVSRYLLDEHALLQIYDPKVLKTTIYNDLTNWVDHNQVKKLVQVCNSPYEAATGAHAIVVLTEWDEFRNLNYKTIYNLMQKPACIFDGRLILEAEKLRQIGFRVFSIGQVSQQY